MEADRHPGARCIPTPPAVSAALAIGAWILCTAAVDTSLVALLRFVFPHPERLDLLVALVSALGVAALVERQVGRPALRDLAVCLGLVAALLVVSAALYDTSWDSESYHLPAVLTLSRGWNPVGGPSGIERVDIWPSAIWFLQAQLARAAGFIEAGKALTGILALASLLLWSGTLAVLTAGAPSAAQRAGAWVLAANPIVLAQLTTFYLDAPVALLSMCLLAGTLLAATPLQVLGVAVACASTVLLVNSKLYGIYYVGMLGLGGCLAAPLLARERVRFVAIGAAASLFGCVVVGWRPFVTNTMVFGTPFYTSSFWATGRPSNLVGMAPPLQFLATLFARTGGWPDDPMAAKLPFLITPREVMFMATPDTRVGGFGPLFGLALLLAVVGTIAVWRAAVGSTHGKVLLRIAVAVAVTCALFPEAWEVRRVAIAWCIPVLLVMAWPEQPRRLVWLRTGVLVLLLSGSFLAFTGNLTRTVWRDWQMTSRIEGLRPLAPLVMVPTNTSQSFEVVLANRFANAGVAARPGNAAECARELASYRGVRICTTRVGEN